MNAMAADLSLSLTMASEQKVVEAGDGIVLRAVLTNTSDSEVAFGYSGSARFDLDLRATMPDGRPAPESKSARRQAADPMSAPSSWITDSLPPGGKVSWTFDAQGLVDVSAPGTYTLQVRWPRKSPSPILSDFLLVTVTPAPDGGGPSAADVLRAANALHPKPSASPFSLTIDTNSSTIHAGQTIGIWYELANMLDRAITFAPGTMYPYAVEVRDQIGNTVPDRNANRLEKERIATGEGDPDLLRQHPEPFRMVGKSTGSLDLNHFVDVSKPGIYSVQLWKKLPVEAGGGEVRSNVIAITVK